MYLWLSESLLWSFWKVDASELTNAANRHGSSLEYVLVQSPSFSEVGDLAEQINV